MNNYQITGDVLGGKVPEALSPLQNMVKQGISLCAQHKISEALEIVERGQQLFPGSPEIINLNGLAMYELGEISAARDLFLQALTKSPQLHLARFNLALAQLKLGDYAQGWKNYEVRWQKGNKSRTGEIKPLDYSLPLWRGKVDTQNTNTKQKRLLVVKEQGYGDTLQFSRLLPLAAKQFARVGLSCYEPLVRLFEWSFAEYDNIYFTASPSDNPLDWDCYCPLMSLPAAIDIQLDNIPPAPYLSVRPSNKLFWQERLQTALSNQPRRLRVGIAWMGSNRLFLDKRRNIDFSQLSNLLQTFANDITWVSLQKMEKNMPVAKIPETLHWLDWSNEFTDFADSAALTSNLDLVITIDSAIAHLAGALHVPTFLLNRFDNEWRWLFKRQDSPWYPSMRIFTQEKFGDWDSVLESLGDALSAMLQSTKT